MATPILKNDYQIKIEIDKLNKELEIYKKVILANQLITSKTELNTIEQIDEFLLNGTDFKNAEAEAVNRKLTKVIDIFNGINRNYSKALNSDYNGVWTINLLLLQQITNEINNKGRI